MTFFKKTSTLMILMVLERRVAKYVAFVSSINTPISQISAVMTVHNSTPMIPQGISQCQTHTWTEDAFCMASVNVYCHQQQTDPMRNP